MNNVAYLINGPKAGERLAIADGTRTIEVLTYVQGCTHYIMPNVQKIIYIPFSGDRWKTIDGADYKEGICPDCIVEAKGRYAKREKELARQNRWYRKLWNRLTAKECE